MHHRLRFHVFALLAAVATIGGIVLYNPATYVPDNVSAAGEASTGSITFSGTEFAAYTEVITITDGTDTLAIQLVNYGGGYSICNTGSAPNCTEYYLDIGGGNDSYTAVAALITTAINSSTLHAVDITAVDAGGGVVNLSGNIGVQPITAEASGTFITSITSSKVTLSGWASYSEIFRITDGVDTVDISLINYGGGFSSCGTGGGSEPNCTEYNLDIGGGNDDNLSVATALAALINSTTIHAVGMTATDNGDGSFNYTGTGAVVSEAPLLFVSVVSFTVANGAPTLTYPSVGLSGDGSGDMLLSVTVDDTDNDSTSVEVKYEAGSSCTYSVASIATVSTTAATGLNSGSLTVVNTSTYQISGIDTTTSSESVTAYWSSATDVSTANGTYCVFFTPYDGSEAGTTVTTTVTVDNVDPTVPGALTVDYRGDTSVRLAFPSVTSTDTNFSTYQMYYKAGSSGVARTDTAHSDTNLYSATFSGATSSTITGLTASTTYVANIWAMDTNGNVTSSATEVSFTTRAAPTASYFSTSTGSTDLSSVPDITSVENFTLASTTPESTTSTIAWSNAVDAEGDDYDTNVILGDRFVSINAENLDSTIDTAATVSFTGVTCSNYALYYASSHQTSRTSLIAAGQLCNAATTPACTVISCTNSTLVFTVPHFDAFGVGEPAAAESGSSESESPSSGGGGSFQLLGDTLSEENTLTEQNPDLQIFSINSGTSVASSREVVLHFGVSNYSQVAVSENADFSDASLVPYVQDMSYTLSAGNGEKTVYVRLTGDGLSTVESAQSIILQTPVAVAEPIVEPIITDEPVSEANCPLEKNKPYKSIDTNRIVYVSESCTQTAFVTRAKYFSYFSSFDAIRLVSESTLDLIPEDELSFLPYGPLYEPADGALVKNVFNPRVYLMKAQKRYPIASEKVFKALGYAWSQIVDVVAERIDSWEEGDTITE